MNIEARLKRLESRYNDPTVQELAAEIVKTGKRPETAEELARKYPTVPAMLGALIEVMPD